MTTTTHVCTRGAIVLPVQWRNAQTLDLRDRVGAAVYRGALTIWRGEAYDGSWPLIVRANGTVYLPRELMRELGWSSYEHVRIEWDDDDDTLVLTRVVGSRQPKPAVRRGLRDALDIGDASEEVRAS